MLLGEISHLEMQKMEHLNVTILIPISVTNRCATNAPKSMRLEEKLKA